MISRRQLIQRGGIALVSLIFLRASSCSGDTIKGILNTVLAAAKALLGLIAPGSALYTQFSAAIAALEADEASWTAGGAISLIEQGLTAVEDVLAVIPVTMAFSPLIAILVAGIDAVLNLIPQPTAVAPAARRTNPYQGQATLTPPHLFQTRAGAFKEQWGKKAVEIGFPQAQLT